jgi:hypothetical protein
MSGRRQTLDVTEPPDRPGRPRFRRALMATAIVVIVVGLAGLIVWGFVEGRGEASREAEREQADVAPAKVSYDAAGAPIITLNPTLEQQSGIKVMVPRPAPYEQQLQAYGSVLDLQQFTELSNAIANAKAQLTIAQAKLTASQAAFHRAQVLHRNEQNISTAQLEAAEATYQSDQAGLRAAQVQAENAAASARQAWGPVLGQALVDGDPAAQRLIDRRDVLVQVTLPPGVSLSQPPQSASIQTDTGQRAGIRLVSPATRTDPRIQGVSFFYTADAASGALPGMNVMAFLPAGRPTPGALVPAPAIVWLQGRAWVYLQAGTATFTRREIDTTLPAPDGGYVVPVAAAPPSEGASPAPGVSNPAGAPGLPAGTLLVVSGAQTLLSEEFRAQIQRGD